MKIKQLALRTLSSALVAGIVVLGSCSKSTDNPLSSADSQNVNSESLSDSYTSETSDIANSVVTNVTNTSYGVARVAGDVTGLEAKDSRLTGATITLTPSNGSTKDNPSGTIKIDFGNGVTTNGVTRKGLITITYNGRKWVEGSTRVISYTGYSRNDVAFDDGMTYTITNVLDSTQFHHVLAGGLLTFSDNTTIHRNSDFNVTLDYTAKTVTLSASSATHSASGVTRASKEYFMDIDASHPLVYKVECLPSKVFIPVSGKKSITAGLLTYAVDYGDGTCDNTVTITVAGKSVVITASANGN